MEYVGKDEKQERKFPVGSWMVTFENPKEHRRGIEYAAAFLNLLIYRSGFQSCIIEKPQCVTYINCGRPYLLVPVELKEVLRALDRKFAEEARVAEDEAGAAAGESASPDAPPTYLDEGDEGRTAYLDRHVRLKMQAIGDQRIVVSPAMPSSVDGVPETEGGSATVSWDEDERPRMEAEDAALARHLQEEEDSRGRSVIADGGSEGRGRAASDFLRGVAEGVVGGGRRRMARDSRLPGASAAAMCAVRRREGYLGGGAGGGRGDATPGLPVENLSTLNLIYDGMYDRISAAQFVYDEESAEVQMQIELGDGSKRIISAEDTIRVAEILDGSDAGKIRQLHSMVGDSAASLSMA